MGGWASTTRIPQSQKLTKSSQRRRGTERPSERHADAALATTRDEGAGPPRQRIWPVVDRPGPNSPARRWWAGPARSGQWKQAGRCSRGVLPQPASHATAGWPRCCGARRYRALRGRLRAERSAGRPRGGVSQRDGQPAICRPPPGMTAPATTVPPSPRARASGRPGRPRGDSFPVWNPVRAGAGRRPTRPDPACRGSSTDRLEYTPGAQPRPGRRLQEQRRFRAADRICSGSGSPSTVLTIAG